MPEVILSRAVAKELFKDEPALGKTIYDSLGSPARVVGLYEVMLGSWPTWDKLDHTALHPAVADALQAVYFVRAQPGRRDELMKIAEDRLNALDNGRIITQGAFRREDRRGQLCGRPRDGGLPDAS